MRLIESGIPVSVLPKYLVCDVIDYEQRRKHRKKRVNKKWFKRYGKKPVYGPEKSYIMDYKLFIGPDTYQALCRQNLEAERRNDVKTDKGTSC